MLDLLLCRDLDDRNFRLIVLIHKLQQELGHVRRQDLALALDVSVPTIERRLAQLKDLGLLTVERVGRLRIYDIPLMNEAGQNHEVPSEPKEPYHLTPHLDDGIFEPHHHHLDDGHHSTDTHHLGDASSPIIYLDTYRSKLEESKKQYSPERRRADKMKISGPEGKLNNLLHSAQEKSEVAKKDREQRRAKRIKEEADLLPETAMTDQCKRRVRHENTERANYNVDDLRILFQDLWTKSGLRGRPTRWTLKERANVKDMIKDQGADVVAEYFEYVFENWADIQDRYRITGYPTLPAMYGYRRTWIPECLNGAQGTSRPKALVEYNEAEAANIPSGSWG